MVEYDAETKTMTSNSAEPVYFLLMLGVIIVWSFAQVVFSPEELKWVPLSSMALALGLITLYVIDRKNDSNTIDSKYFKQATLKFYVSCLESATASKARWRGISSNKKTMSKGSRERRSTLLED